MSDLESYDKGQIYAKTLFFIYLFYSLYVLLSFESLDSVGKGLILLLFSPIIYFILWIIGLIFAAIIDHFREKEEDNQFKERSQERSASSFKPYTSNYSSPINFSTKASTNSSTTEKGKYGRCNSYGCTYEGPLHWNGQCEDHYYDDDDD
jgi:hypothetical protein